MKLTRLSSCLLTLWLCSHPTASGEMTSQYSVRAFGAAGDGVQLDTAAINQAIEAAATKGGGTVYFPAGEYLSHSIRLKSHVTLYLDAGATILAADPPKAGEPGGYDPPEASPCDLYQDFGHTYWHNSLIWGEDLEHVAILGPGLIFGRGLSSGHFRKDPYPHVYPVQGVDEDDKIPLDESIQPGPFGYPHSKDTLPAGIGNKAIALKNCRNVILRDFSVLHGGHFAILATGVDNLTIDNLTIDTNRDGMDIDACVNVRISNCAINSPIDDGICLKSSYGLGYARTTENVLITNCFVSGFDEGTLLDGTRQRNYPYPIGRIKFGTEANGGFQNVTISNCVFEYCRGLAIEEVDGGILEDVAITNLTMRDIFNAPIFVRLGGRLRGPEGTPMSILRRVRISNVVASNVGQPFKDYSPQGILIAGVPGHPIEDLTISGIRMTFVGNGTPEMVDREVPELVRAYPEPGKFGILPSWGVYARHVRNLNLRDIDLRTVHPDPRPVAYFEDVEGLRVNGFAYTPMADPDSDPIILRDVQNLSATEAAGF